ncbi:hypothetical protein M440DRAFT_1255986 [Trichoderma longibrachiatum ATCC 18648]|uniref:Uncharacterized protein n=1 Tax=Trichoderma longibrachiatum ATCC 18648 TaxID=983965 RepID=A0A2T4C1S7_TRILO|nr:hypothetical protein M440DRAFT_1255986 [Trichoderma longibrachiatum ATCC 18648]
MAIGANRARTSSILGRAGIAAQQRQSRHALSMEAAFSASGGMTMTSLSSTDLGKAFRPVVGKMRVGLWGRGSWPFLCIVLESCQLFLVRCEPDGWTDRLALEGIPDPGRTPEQTGSPLRRLREDASSLDLLRSNHRPCRCLPLLFFCWCGREQRDAGEGGRKDVKQTRHPGNSPDTTSSDEPKVTAETMRAKVKQEGHAAECIAALSRHGLIGGRSLSEPQQTSLSRHQPANPSLANCQ